MVITIKQSIRWNQWLIWMPLVTGCLLLAITGWWAIQKIKTLTQITAMTAYSTSPYQGKNYAIVPPANVLQGKDGNYCIESIAVKIRQVVFHSSTLADEDATQQLESSAEDMDMD